jgi:hypothetical protein
MYDEWTERMFAEPMPVATNDFVDLDDSFGRL